MQISVLKLTITLPNIVYSQKFVGYVFLSGVSDGGKQTMDPMLANMKMISMAQWKRDVTTLLTHCKCASFALNHRYHYNDIVLSAMASQITGLIIVYSTVYSRRRSKKTPKLRVTGL